MTQATEPGRHFAGCPECGKDDGYLNAGRSHWMVCDEHRVMWCIGSNLFSSWREETEAEQRELWKRVEDYADLTSDRSAPPPKLIKTAIAFADDGTTQSLNVIRVGSVDVSLPRGTDLQRTSWLLRQLADELAEQCPQGRKMVGFGREEQITADWLGANGGAQA